MKKNIISEIKEKYNVKENFSLMMEDENKILEILNGNAVLEKTEKKRILTGILHFAIMCRFLTGN